MQRIMWTVLPKSAEVVLAPISDPPPTDDTVPLDPTEGTTRVDVIPVAGLPADTPLDDSAVVLDPSLEAAPSDVVVVEEPVSDATPVDTTAPLGASEAAAPTDVVAGDAIRLRFSVLVSPRLGGTSGHLDEFGDFLDWPATVGSLGFSLAFEGGPSFAAYLDPDAPHPPRSDVWTGIFGPRTPVTPHSFDDHSNNQVLSYPEASTAAMLAGTYTGTVGTTPTVPPTPNEWKDPSSGLPTTVDALRVLDRDRAAVLAGLNGLLAEQGFIPGSAVTTPVEKAAVLEQFLGGPQPGHVDVSPQDLAPTPDFDFHQALAVLSQYSMLQRLVGTVLDCYADVPLDLVGDWTIHLELDPDPSDTPLRPGTRCRVSRDRFDATPLDDSYIDRGYLKAGGSRFAPITFDVDGGVLKLASLAAVVATSPDPLSAEPLAALRSAGVSLAVADRAGLVATSLKRAKKNNDDLEAGLAVTLYAEDLVRGFRPDIWEDEAGRWSSLTAQVGTLSVASAFGGGVAGLPPLTDEAMVTTSPTSEDPSGVQLKLPESLFGWTGWSLATAQPGSVLANPKADGSGGVLDAPTSGPRPDLDVAVSVKPKSASLPVLRFGALYRVRVRTVDLAGNGPSLNQASSTSDETQIFRYGRFEPVPTPEVLLMAPRSEGETVDRIVIRSQGPSDTSPTISLRHIAPPTTSWGMSETHGLFDRVAGGRVGPDPAAYAAHSQREKGGLSPRTGANGEVVKHPDAEMDPSTPGSFFYPSTPLSINYLPDAFAKGACLRGLPGFFTPEWVSFLEDGQSWPNHKAFQVRVQEAAASPAFEPTSRVLTVGLGKAEVVEVFLHSFFADGVEDRMGVFDLLPGAVKTAQRINARLGFLWALTPSRKLTLVHAVRVPLVAPEHFTLHSLRNQGEPFTMVIGQVNIHRKSTGRVDVSARWTDCVDDPSTVVTGSGVLTAAAFEVQRQPTPAFSIDADRVVDPPMKTDLLDIGDRHEFGDTKHRLVSYALNGVTRFAEYFIEHKEVTAAGAFLGDQIVGLGGPLVEGSVVVRTSDRSQTFLPGTAFTVDHASGQLKLHIGTGGGLIPAGTELVISYLAAPISVASSGEKTISIKSSARPAPPEVEFVLPTFGWNLSGARRRLGRGLRVYLRRPWFSSGCREQLGVVLWQTPLPARAVFPNAPLHVTHWAQDPLYAGPPLPSDWPSLASFQSKVAEPAAVGLTLPEFSSPVDVAVHNVAFDTDRQLWFADLVLDVGSAYNPFVRLAFSRYQKESLPGLELSQVSRVDYMQLAPDRAMALFPAGTSTRVIVTGPDGSTVAGPGVAEAWVEEKDPDIDADELGWGRVGGVIPLTRSVFGDNTVWEGLVKLPSGTGRRRIVVQQMELFPVDSTAIVSVPARRVVYTDAVEI